MATWNNNTKATTTFTNLALNAGNNITWDEATFTWDEASARTWNVPRTVFNNQSKVTTTFTNNTKN